MRAAFAVAPALCAGAVAAQDGPTWAEVGALFAERCVMCHSGEFAPLGLRLDGYDTALTGSENGPVLVAGDPEASPLIGRIKGLIEPRMPMDGPPWLEDALIAMVEAWVLGGMPEGVPTVSVAEPAPVRPQGQVWFSDVEPIILQRCVKCHSEGSILGAPPEDLRLSDLPLILSGGENVVVVPGNAALSLMWRHVAGIEEPQMPFDGPPFLSDAEIGLIRDWIDGGAPDADGNFSVLQQGGEFRVEGILTAEREIDGGPFVVTGGTRVEDGFSIGGRYELRAMIGADGSVIATRLRER